MKKGRFSVLFFGAAVILALLFVVLSLADYAAYDNMQHSAPYWVFLLVRAATFLFPALCMALAGFFMRKMERKKRI